MGYKYKYGKQMLYIIMDLNMLTFSYPNITHFSWWDISHQYYHIYDIYMYTHDEYIYIYNNNDNNNNDNNNSNNNNDNHNSSSNNNNDNNNSNNNNL